MVNQFYFGSLLGTTPAGAYTYAVTVGSLPPGLSLDNLAQAVYGSLATANTFTFSLSATNPGNAACLGAEPYGDTPVPGDYDGDHKTDLAVFRKLDGTWYIVRSSDAAIVTRQWGLSTDKPVPGDYDGDGKTDIAVWRGQTSTWFIIRSGSGLLQMVSWGACYAPFNDVPVPGDYDGDGKTDIAVWRPAQGMWYSLNSSDGSIRIKQHGQAGDVPVTAAGVR